MSGIALDVIPATVPTRVGGIDHTAETHTKARSTTPTVHIMGDTCPEYFYAHLGSIVAGAVPVDLQNADATTSYCGYIAKECDAQVWYEWYWNSNYCKCVAPVVLLKYYCFGDCMDNM